MKLTELKKAKPITMKSSGTDDPKKYVGGWETYDKPQGINSRQDHKVLAMEADDGVEEWNGKHVVWSDGNYRIAVNIPDDATFVTLWTDSNERVGSLATRNISKYPNWLSIRNVYIEPKHQGIGLGFQMYRLLLKNLNPNLKGLIGYMPDVTNKRQIPAIYRKLGGYPDPDNSDVILVPRTSIGESVGSMPMNRFVPDEVMIPLEVGPKEEDEIKKSKRPAMKTVRASTRALSARGAPPRLNPYKLDETVRRPFSGTLSNEYEIVDDDDNRIGYARVDQGVINELDYTMGADQQYRGQILSALLDQIVHEADRNNANVMIQLELDNVEIKYLFERFGFRMTSDRIMRRAVGSIHPGTVNPPQGIVNRDT